MQQVDFFLQMKKLSEGHKHVIQKRIHCSEVMKYKSLYRVIPEDDRMTSVIREGK